VSARFPDQAREARHVLLEQTMDGLIDECAVPPRPGVAAITPTGRSPKTRAMSDAGRESQSIAS